MGYYPQESLYKPYKYHGYTVRGTPNCPLSIYSASMFISLMAEAQKPMEVLSVACFGDGSVGTFWFSGILLYITLFTFQQTKPKDAQNLSLMLS